VAQPPSLDQAALDPIVDDVLVDSKVLGHLWHGQFLRPLELHGRNLIAPADPPHNPWGIRLTFRADMPFLIEPVPDLRVPSARLLNSTFLKC
jgi:hypothetical protein